MLLHQRPITWLWAARILATPIPAPIPAIGIRPTPLPLARLFPTFQKSRGTIPARACWYRVLRDSAPLTVQPVSVATQILVHTCKPRLQAVAAPAVAPSAVHPSMAAASGRSKARRKLHGDPSLA